MVDELIANLVNVNGQPVNENEIKKILAIKIQDGVCSKWNPKETLDLFNNKYTEAIESNKTDNHIVSSITIKSIEIMKRKYYGYIQQHPEKYGEIDPNKFAAQVEIYFNQKIEQAKQQWYEATKRDVAEHIVNKLNPTPLEPSDKINANTMTLELLGEDLHLRCIEYLTKTGKVYDLQKFRSDFFPFFTNSVMVLCLKLTKF